MSNPEKMSVDESEEEIVQSDEKESATSEIVLDLPGQRSVVAQEQQAPLNVNVVAEEEQQEVSNEQAVVAAELVMAAAQEVVTDGNKKKFHTPKMIMKKMADLAGGSGSKRKPSKSSYPRGPLICDLCGRLFKSWRAVKGHMRSHNYEERNYLVPPRKGTRRPPHFPLAPLCKFTGVVTIPGPRSAFVAYTSGGGRSVAGTSGGAQGHEGERGTTGIHSNVALVEKEDDEEKMVESKAIANFDLNKSPPEDEEEEDQA